MDGARIMIVEDNTMVAEDCRECLESYGFRVSSIRASGEDAVKNAEKERPDAVLMDIKLRGALDGIDAASQIHARFDIPVVFLSAYSDDDLLQRARQVGAFGYLVKPFKERELYTMLETTLYRVKMEKERRRMESRLQKMQKMEAIGRLAGGVAHDLNNMLSIIMGYTQSAMDLMDPAGAANEDLQEVLAAAHRSAELVKQLLTFARRQVIAPKVLDMNKEVETNLDRLRRLIGENVELIWRPGERLWPLKMDPSQIDQVLTHLCINAKEAISAEGRIIIATGRETFDSKSCRVHEGAAPGEYVFLRISDNGCGMAGDALKTLFEPFFTTKEFGEQCGLGLSVIYGIVRQNDGFIEVHSTPEEGSTFNIYLPRYISKTDEKSAAKQPEKEHYRVRKTILLVEDEPAILRMTAMMLKRQGYAVLTASTPKEAIRLAKTHGGEINLVMTDVVMPEINGRELVRCLLSHYPDLKSLYMSGHSADTVFQRGYLEGHTHFIQKPFSRKDLEAKVCKVLSEETKDTESRSLAPEAAHAVLDELHGNEP